MNFSVIICTHNPREDYLQRTLDSLKAQTLPKDQWEILLIDNASKELLAGIWDLSWHPNARHVREDKLGLTAARLRGIQESASDILVFVDDDNVLEPDYLAVALRLAGEHTKLGCFGAGVLEPEYEEEPALELKPYTSLLALRTVAAPQWSNSMDDPIIPWGAGLVVRKVVAEKYLALVQSCSIRSQLDRCGSNLNSGGDDEFSWVACDSGLGKGLFSDLRITHLIGRKRVKRQYLLDLVKGHSYSNAILCRLHGKQIYSPPPFSTLGDIFRSVCCARISVTIYHLNSWWAARHRTKLESEIDQATREGVKLALGDLEKA